MMRLNKFLAHAGVGSRRSVEENIAAGEVRVNGAIIRNPAHRVVPETDTVQFCGNLVSIYLESTYVLLNKPVGYITTAKDEKGRPTAVSLVRSPTRLFPVGRLDRDSCGLLLLTNDGELTHRLLHPRYKVQKTYWVRLDRPISPEVEQQFKQGVVIDKKYRVRGDIRFNSSLGRKVCAVTIGEGRNRQIRKMFVALGLRVVELERTEFGPLKLGRLKPAAWRYLTDHEIDALKKATRLSDGNHQ